MSIANLCRQGETSPYNTYQFSGKLYDESDDYTFDTAGNDTLPEVLVHELSHKSLKTKDTTYGKKIL